MLRVVLVVWIFCKHARTAKENGLSLPKKTSTFCSYFIKCNNFIRKRTESHFLARGFEPHFRFQFHRENKKKKKGELWNHLALLRSAVRFRFVFFVCFLCFVKFSTCSRRPLACSRFGCYHSLKKNNIAWIVFVLFFFSVYSPLCLSLALSILLLPLHACFDVVSSPTVSSSWCRWLLSCSFLFFLLLHYFSSSVL